MHFLWITLSTYPLFGGKVNTPPVSQGFTDFSVFIANICLFLAISDSVFLYSASAYSKMIFLHTQSRFVTKYLCSLYITANTANTLQILRDIVPRETFIIENKPSKRFFLGSKPQK